MYNRDMKRTCKQCKKTFATPPSQNKLYCSRTCYTQHRRETITYTVAETGCHICTSHHGDKDGYPKITRKVNGKAKTYHLSRFLYEKAYGKLPENVFVLHSCDNPMCINLEHLHPGTALENSHEAVTRGRIAHGEQCHLAKLTAPQVRTIMNLLPSHTDLELARQFGVVPATIWFIRTGRTWKHVAP